MSTTNNAKRTAAALGLTAVMSLGLAAIQIKPAEARHRRRHYRVVTPAYGYRNGADYGSTKFWRNDVNKSKRNPFGDRDGDGIPNKYDRDIDGDGIRNSKDHHPFKANRR